MGTKNKPGKFDCYEKAEPDEPMFVLIGRDPAAAQLVRLWAAIHADMGDTKPEKLEEARECADQLEKWARDNEKPVDVAVKEWENLAVATANRVHSRRP